MADQIDFSELNERIEHFIKTGEIGSHLSLKATMAVHDARNRWDRIRPEIAAFEQRRFEVLALVAAHIEDICFKVKEFELKHWMGFCDEDVKELMVLRRRWSFLDWETASDEEKTELRKLWDPLSQQGDLNDDDYWKPGWQKYIDRRRVKKPLQVTCLKDSPCSATTDHYKVMMASTAGRVLITVQDRYPQEDKRSKFGGAWVTMIFDESACYPRGGLQGQCSTRDEGVALVQALIDDMPKMKPDHKISIC